MFSNEKFFPTKLSLIRYASPLWKFWINPPQNLLISPSQRETHLYWMSQKILLRFQNHKTSLKLHLSASSKVSTSALTVTTTTSHPVQRCHLPSTKKPLPNIPPPPKTRNRLLNTPLSSLASAPPLLPTPPPPPPHKPKYPPSCNWTSRSCPSFAYSQPP